MHSANRSKAAGVLLGLLLAFPLRYSQAQITFDGCRDVAGRPVASIRSAVQDVAMAGLAPNGSPVIYYNPQVLSFYSPVTRLFWYGHECGHHALGHSLGGGHPLTREQEADCWGIRNLVDAGLADDSDIQTVQSELARNSRGDWTHLPGPQRAINLRRCLGEPDSELSDDSDDACEYANDGECNEPDLCRRGTDVADCGSRPRRRERRRTTQPTTPALGARCMTQAGACQLPQLLPQGSPCFCIVPGGSLGGIVVQ